MHPTRHMGLAGLVPHLREFIPNGSALVYIPGKRDPTQDETDVYDVARELGLSAYSMCLEKLNRRYSITGDFTRYDFRQTSPHPLVVLNGVFGNWSGEIRDNIVPRGVHNLRGIMSTADLSLPNP